MQRILLILGTAGLAGGLTFAGRPGTDQGRKTGFPWWAWAFIIVVPLGLLTDRLLRRRAMQPEAAAPGPVARFHVQVASIPAVSIPPAIQEMPLPARPSTSPTTQAQKPSPSVSMKETPAKPQTSEDDLTVIEGIGPVISGVLRKAGVKSFSQLAQMDVSQLQQILRDAGLRLGDPTTWPEQARLAAAGDWDGLKALTEQLRGGRRK